MLAGNILCSRISRRSWERRPWWIVLRNVNCSNRHQTRLETSSISNTVCHEATALFRSDRDTQIQTCVFLGFDLESYLAHYEAQDYCRGVRYWEFPKPENNKCFLMKVAPTEVRPTNGLGKTLAFFGGGMIGKCSDKGAKDLSGESSTCSFYKRAVPDMIEFIPLDRAKRCWLLRNLVEVRSSY